MIRETEHRVALVVEETIRLFGTEMQAWTMEQTVDEIARRLSTESFTQHVVVNVAKLVHMQSDPALKNAVESCDIVNIDGAGIVLGGRLLGYDIPERVAGIDLFYRLLDLAERTGKRVFFLGARPEVLETAVDNLRSMYPDLDIAGYHHGYFWDDESLVVENIHSLHVDLLFVGISSPMKEQFIEKWNERLGVRFAMGVGGTFDVVAGKVRRAPRWMQENGLEWLYRVIQEPRRMFMRYLKTNSKFAWMLLIEWTRRTVSRGDQDNASH